MLADRQARTLAEALEDCRRSIGKCPAPCFLVLHTVADVTLIAHSRRRNTPPRLGARPRGGASLRGDLHALSRRSATSRQRRRSAITCRQHIPRTEASTAARPTRRH